MSISYFTPDGTPKEYRTVSERLPEFLEAFPLSEGYSIVREHENYTQTLWKAAIEAGVKPTEMGLANPANPQVVFRCRLVKDGNTVLNASAYKAIHGPKDWEAGETASFQRLMAAAGFGGEVMDNDDRYDRISSGLEGEGDHAQPSANDVSPGPAPVSGQAEQHATEPEPMPERAPGTTPMPIPQGQSVQPPHGAVRPQLLNQLRQMAALAGEQTPDVSSDAEAKQEIKRLRDKTRNAS